MPKKNEMAAHIEGPTFDPRRFNDAASKKTTTAINKAAQISYFMIALR
jgi:hypothetical protein